MKLWLRRAALLAGGSLIALALVEIALWGLGAMIAGRVANGSVDPETGERRFTILCVGDSWTQGAPTGRFPDMLIDQLNRRQDRVRFRQVNVGRAGTNSSQALRRLPEQIATHEPDLLLVMTGNNDHHNLTHSTYWRFEDRSLGWGALFAARVRTSVHSLRVYRLARTALQKASGGPTANEFFVADGAETEDRAGLIAIDRATHRRQLEYNLTQLVDLARIHDLPIVFQTYFHFHGYRVNEIVRDVATAHDVPLVDNNLLFHTRVPAQHRESYRIPDGHPNADGYRLIAGYIVEALDEHRLLP